MLRDKIMQISLTGSVYDKHELKIIVGTSKLFVDKQNFYLEA